MHSKHDYRANIAFKWMFAPILTITIGFVSASIATGWDAIAFFSMMLLLSAALCPVPVILGVLALKGGTSYKEKALLAIMVPLMALFTYAVSFGGLST